MRRNIIGLILIIAVLAFSGCGQGGNAVVSPSAGDGGQSAKAVSLTAEQIRQAREMVQEGENLFRQNKMEEAFAQFNKAVEKNPLETNAYVGMAMVQMRTKQVDKALETFDKAIALDPGNAQVLGMKGTVLLRENKFQDAIGIYEKMKGIDPKNPIPYSSITRCYIGLKEYDKAEQEMKKAGELMPDNYRLFSTSAELMKREAAGLKGDEAARMYGRSADMYGKAAEAYKEDSEIVRSLLKYGKSNALYQKYKITGADEDKKATVSALKEYYDEYKAKRGSPSSMRGTVSKLTELTGEKYEMPKLPKPERREIIPRDRAGHKRERPRRWGGPGKGPGMMPGMGEPPVMPEPERKEEKPAVPGK